VLVKMENMQEEDQRQADLTEESELMKQRWLLEVKIVAT
jgi:hypothetical protein